MAHERVKERKKKNRALLDTHIKQAKSNPCKDCAITYKYYVMDFDHRDPAEKEFLISRATHKNVSLDRLKREIEKCDLVCANCHRERTFKSIAF